MTRVVIAGALGKGWEACAAAVGEADRVVRLHDCAKPSEFQDGERVAAPTTRSTGCAPPAPPTGTRSASTGRSRATDARSAPAGDWSSESTTSQPPTRSSSPSGTTTSTFPSGPSSCSPESTGTGGSAPSDTSSNRASRTVGSHAAAPGANPRTGSSTRTEQHQNDGEAHQLRRRFRRSDQSARKVSRQVRRIRNASNGRSQAAHGLITAKESLLSRETTRPGGPSACGPGACGHRPGPHARVLPCAPPPHSSPASSPHSP